MSCLFVLTACQPVPQGDFRLDNEGIYKSCLLSGSSGAFVGKIGDFHEKRDEQRAVTPRVLRLVSLHNTTVQHEKLATAILTSFCCFSECTRCAHLLKLSSRLLARAASCGYFALISRGAESLVSPHLLICLDFTASSSA